jgi:hypothetical protein
VTARVLPNKPMKLTVAFGARSLSAIRYNTKKETDKCLPVMHKELGFRTILPLCPSQEQCHRRRTVQATGTRLE